VVFWVVIPSRDRNVGILPHHYTASRPKDGGSMVLRNVGILPHHDTLSQPEDWGSIVLRNFDILPHHYTASQPEDGNSMILRNFGILLHFYTASQPIFIALKTPRLAWWYFECLWLVNKKKLENREKNFLAAHNACQFVSLHQTAHDRRLQMFAFS